MRILNKSIIFFACFAGVASADENVLSELLRDELWIGRDAYDASHFLMIPMVDAFQGGNVPLMNEYRSFFMRYLNDKKRDNLGVPTQLQFDYLVSRYLVLETSNKVCSIITRSLANFLKDDLQKNIEIPAWHWGMPKFSNMFERIEWKLAHVPSAPAYMHAFFDEELFAFGVAADLAVVLPRCGMEISEHVRKAANFGQEIFLTQGAFEQDMWQFQPGVWRDHNDYEYAGHMSLATELSKSPVDGIGLDSSHSTRFPLWIESLRCAAAPESEGRERLEDIREGMARNFLRNVYVAPSEAFPAVRLKNYMSGHNGIYRYNYISIGKGGGYEPFGLSLTFNLGWWSFLGSSMAEPYASQLRSLPFALAVEKVFLQPVVTDKNAPRARHPMFSPNGFVRGDLVKIILGAALRVSQRRPLC